MPPKIDVLFEFDAPKFRDLSVPISYPPPGEHDVWFDQIHVDHSKPSEELARDFADLVRELEGKKEQLRDVVKLKSRHDKRTSSAGVDKRNQELKSAEKKYVSLKERRTTQKPFQGKIDIKTELRAPKRRQPLANADNRLNSQRKREVSGDDKEMKDIRELLKKHNKKVKTAHVYYEPSRHSVREVKQWERETKKSYFALSAEERVRANQEIALWKKQRQDQKQ